MESIKTSLICTVFNEEKTIIQFLESIDNQSKQPDEIIIVDGGSKDNTAAKISGFKSKNKKFNLKVFVKKGNRSVGRNFGIQKAKGNIIACSDSGCVLDKNWVKEIVKPFRYAKVDVVAGYYKGAASNIFQKSLIPYVLVMEDKIKENDFLPATRSMAFKKNVWEKVGRFNEELSHNEDYAFANKLKTANFKITFARKAIVYWLPRKNIKQAFVMFLRFAFGDGESGIIRDKVLLIFARYIFYAYLIAISILIKSLILFLLLIIFPLIYIAWSIWKNYKYVNNAQALIYLPVIQIISDFSVLIGTTLGYIKKISKLNLKLIIKNNFGLLALIGIYIITMLSIINVGIPNQSHPFPYQMDEWHQSQSVRNVFKFGTPNLPGSANGSMFHFFMSGILLIPFILLKIVNPFVIKSAIDAISMQEMLFLVFRLNTLFFGVLTLILMSKIAKNLKLNSFLAVLLFFVTSVWLSLSNFFKYDIALMFWIVFSFYYLVKYSSVPTLKNFVIVCFLSALAFSVKVSALPLVSIFVLAYLLFTPSIKNNWKHFALGLLVYFFTVIFFGTPDVIFGGRSMFDYLYDNIVTVPGMLGSFRLGETLFNMTVIHKLPLIFGHAFYLFGIFSFVYVLISAVTNYFNNKVQPFKIKLFILLSFLVFALSLAELGITISANRAIVLLPFFVLLDLIVLKEIESFLKNRRTVRIIMIVVLLIGLMVQVFESYLWVGLRFTDLPEQASSRWIVKNIPKNSNVGLENIPLYQSGPDYTLKEFYEKQYHLTYQARYNYFIIDSKTQILPKYVVLTNVYYEQKFLKVSVKNKLVAKLKNLGYKEISRFPLQIPPYKYFDSYFYYPYMGLIAFPESISVFEK